ncbi:MAG: 30S ribosomal protein S3 [Clostridia bacterium]|nr:30S ribosomal protein S3 [Clostridia bacterium]MDD4386416.1 30S ribosomal protein S3 [Clostridia bacterium]
MGQKVNPHGLRVGIIKDWSSTWYADKKEFSDKLVEDYKIRKYLKNLLKSSGIDKLTIERKGEKVKVNIFTAKPGMIIGKGGAAIEELKKNISKLVNKQIDLNIVEVKDVDLSATLVAENIAGQLERRISFRKAMKQSMQKTMKIGALGIKTAVSGRLGGAEIARTEHYSEGTIPLQTLRADIDYGFAEAKTTFGITGVKVWIYKGEVLPIKKNAKGGN